MTHYEKVQIIGKVQDEDEIGTGNEFDQAFEIIRKANAPEDVYNLKICITYIDKE